MPNDPTLSEIPATDAPVAPRHDGDQDDRVPDITMEVDRVIFIDSTPSTDPAVIEQLQARLRAEKARRATTDRDETVS